MSFREVNLRPNPERPVIERLVDYEQFCGVPQAQAAEAKQVATIPEITVQELQQVLAKSSQEIVLLDVRNPHEYEIARIPGSVLIPLSEIESGQAINQVRELVNGSRLIAHCKMGAAQPKHWPY